MTEGSSAKDPFFMYIYDLPYLERRNLCDILDIHDKWKELGGIHMTYDVATLNRIGQAVKRDQSPTNELLTLWQTQNHTVLELFVLLSLMKHYQAMIVIKNLVNPKYHNLIYEGEGYMGIRTSYENNSKPPSAPTASGASSASPKTGAPPQDEKPMEYGVNLMKGASDNKCSKVLKDSFCIPATREESKVDNNSPSKLQGATASANNSYYAGAAAAVTNAAAAAAAALRPSAASPMKEPNSAHKESNISSSRRKSPNAASFSSSAEAFTPLINYQELEAATNNWDKAKILGKGGFGTVYRGTWKNTQVAIKRLMLQKDATAEELVETQRQQSSKELKYLSSFRHDNILPLYGYSVGGEAPCLVYQFLPNGSLEDRLRCRNNTKPLVWAQRLNIAIGTARGLNYLHSVSDKALIHGDIKSANILLDQNFEPKIGDFGLAREGPMQQYTHMKVSKVYGTRPYLPEEFLRARKFSVKVDIFSFGVVLFEIATGLRAYDEHRQEKYLYNHVRELGDEALHVLVDGRADADTSHTATGLMQLGKCCVHQRPGNRPLMPDVLQQLNILVDEREKLHKANIMARHNSLQPTTPIELQIAHDHSQQRRLSAPNPPIVRQQQTPSLHLAQAQPVLTNNQQTLSPQISVTPPSNVNSAVSAAAAALAASSINRAASSVTANSNVNNNTTTNSNQLPRVLNSYQEENHNAQAPVSTSACDDIPLLSALGMK